MGFVVGLSRISDTFEPLFGKDEKRGKCLQCTMPFANWFICVQLKQTTNLDNKWEAFVIRPFKNKRIIPLKLLIHIYHFYQYRNLMLKE